MSINIYFPLSSKLLPTMLQSKTNKQQKFDIIRTLTFSRRNYLTVLVRYFSIATARERKDNKGFLSVSRKERAKARENLALHARHCCTFMFVFVGGPHSLGRGTKEEQGRGKRAERRREGARATGRRWRKQTTIAIRVG